MRLGASLLFFFLPRHGVLIGLNEEGALKQISRREFSNLPLRALLCQTEKIQNGHFVLKGVLARRSRWREKTERNVNDSDDDQDDNDDSENDDAAAVSRQRLASCWGSGSRVECSRVFVN